jgi:hypothetical protein
MATVAGRLRPSGDGPEMGLCTQSRMTNPGCLPTRTSCASQEPSVTPRDALPEVRMPPADLSGQGGAKRPSG